MSITRLSSLGLVSLVSFIMTLAGACGGGGTPTPATGKSAVPGEKEPSVVIGDSSAEVFEEETSGVEGSKSKSREYFSDVSYESGVKGDPTAPVEKKKLRVIVRFPVPKVEPKDAREPHVVNRVLWEVRKQMALCWYKGGGKTPSEELTMVGFLKLDKKGGLVDSGIEKSDEKLSKNGVDACILENVKGLTFTPAGDETKIRFKLRIQTLDGSTLADFTEPPPAKP